jgi:hypothetical protein
VEEEGFGVTETELRVCNGGVEEDEGLCLCDERSGRCLCEERSGSSRSTAPPHSTGSITTDWKGHETAPLRYFQYIKSAFAEQRTKQFEIRWEKSRVSARQQSLKLRKCSNL